MLTPLEVGQFLSNRLLHLILMPTEQCNFRCAYCYEDFELGEMPPEVVEGVKALLGRRAPDLDLLSIDWFGGEPMLAFPTVVELQSFACRLADERRRLVVSASMTTNASLLNLQRFRRLLGLRVRTFQISLDGPREHHDRTRVTRGKKGTFRKVWRHLLAMREVGEPFVVVLRVHATRDNLSSLGGFIEVLAEHFGGDERFRLSLRPVRRLGGHDDEAIPVLDPAQTGRLESLRGEARDAGLSLHEGPFASGSLRGCYAAATNSLVVRSNGDLAKCTVALRHPRNRVGALGRDGRVALDSAKMMGWARGVLGEDESSLACPKVGWADDENAVAGGLVQLGTPDRLRPDAS